MRELRLEIPLTPSSQCFTHIHAALTISTITAHVTLSTVHRLLVEFSFSRRRWCNSGSGDVLALISASVAPCSLIVLRMPSIVLSIWSIRAAAASRASLANSAVVDSAICLSPGLSIWPVVRPGLLPDCVRTPLASRSLFLFSLATLRASEAPVKLVPWTVPAR